MSRTVPPSPSPAAATSARQTRLLVAIIGGLFLLLVAGFVAMVVFVQDEVRLNAVGPVAAAPGAERGGLVFQGTLNIWEVHGRMMLDVERQATFELDLRGPTGQPALPDLAFALTLVGPDANLAPIELRHAAVGIGSYAASGRLPMPGRWQLRMALPEVTGVLEFSAER